MSNDSKLPDGMVVSNGSAIRPENLEINSYMKTPTIRPTPPSQAQTTAQNGPTSSDKK